MPWTPPEDYEPRPDLGPYLLSISPRLNTPEFDMVIYWQWVHANPRPRRRRPAQAWRALNMAPAHARGAIDEAIVPLEIYPAAQKRAMYLPAKVDRVLVEYQPRPDLAVYLVNANPRLNTAEFDMVVYWQWVHCMPVPFQKTVARAWRDLDMPQQHAREAIVQRIVPIEIYPDALERAYPSLPRISPSAPRRRVANKTQVGNRDKAFRPKSSR